MTTSHPPTAVDDSVRLAADRLQAAAAAGVPCPPVRDLIGSNDIARAYAVQQLGVEAREARGARIVGRKIGLTSPVVQQQLGVDQPDLGVLFADMAHDARRPVPLGTLLQPKVEAEVAFVLGSDLTQGDLDLAQVTAAVDHVMAAIEICDSRIAGWDISFGDTVADNASAGAFVLGERRRTLAEVTPREVAMRMTVTGEEDSVGSGDACLGDPLLALQWLARTSRALGEPLRAGQVILSGALGPMRTAAPGAEVHVEISGLGAITLRFAADDEPAEGKHIEELS